MSARGALRQIRILAVGTAFLLGSQDAYPASDPTIQTWRIAPGTELPLRGETVSIQGTLGQVDAGTVNAPGVAIVGGFWSFAASFEAPAQVVRWTNQLGGEWHVPANWNPNRIPGIDDIAVIDLPGTYTVRLDYDARCQTLRLGGGGSSGTGTPSLDWSNGTFQGQWIVETNAVVNLVGSSLMLNGVLENRGRLVWSRSPAITWRFLREAKLINRTTGSIDLLGTGAFYSTAGFLPVIENQGVIRKQGDPGRVEIFPPFSFRQDGQLDVQNGSLRLNSLESRGALTVADGAMVEFQTGLIDLLAAHRFAGRGTCWIHAAPTVRGTLDGELRYTASDAATFDARLHSTLIWTNGILSGVLTLAPGAVLDFTALTLEGSITNRGRMEWDGGPWLWRTGAGLFNESEGEVFLASDGILSLPADATLRNLGWLSKSQGAGTLSLRGEGRFENTGKITVQKGVLEMARGLSHSGTLQIETNCVAAFTGGELTLVPPSRFEGPGVVRWGGSGLRMTGRAEGSANLQILGDVNLAATINLPFEWLRGNLTGSLEVGTGGRLTLLTPGALNGALTNRGQIVWIGPDTHAWRWEAGSRLLNTPEGTFDVQNDCRFLGVVSPRPRVFENAGLFRKSLGAGLASFDTGFDFLHQGTLEVRSGRIDFRGSFQASETATVALALGGSIAGSEYAQLGFDLPPQLAGKLQVILRSGYRPSLGQVFELLTFPDRTGEFTAFLGTEIDPTLRLIPRYASRSLQLVAASSELPALTLRRVDNGLRLEGLPGDPNWQLVVATNVAAPVWIPVPLPISSVTGIDLSPTNPFSVFRLRRP